MKQKLIEYMEENGLNQRQLADLLGVSESHLSRVMNDKWKAGAKVAEKYYQLPGVKEKEAINQVRETINQLWTHGNINNDIAKKLLVALENPGD